MDALGASALLASHCTGVFTSDAEPDKPMASVVSSAVREKLKALNIGHDLTVEKAKQAIQELQKTIQDLGGNAPKILEERVKALENWLTEESGRSKMNLMENALYVSSQVLCLLSHFPISKIYKVGSIGAIALTNLVFYNVLSIVNSSRDIHYVNLYKKWMRRADTFGPVDKVDYKFKTADALYKSFFQDNKLRPVEEIVAELKKYGVYDLVMARVNALPGAKGQGKTDPALLQKALKDNKKAIYEKYQATVTYMQTVFLSNCKAMITAKLESAHRVMRSRMLLSSTYTVLSVTGTTLIALGHLGMVAAAVAVIAANALTGVGIVFILVGLVYVHSQRMETLQVYLSVEYLKGYLNTVAKTYYIAREFLAKEEEKARFAEKLEEIKEADKELAERLHDAKIRDFRDEFQAVNPSAAWEMSPAKMIEQILMHGDLLPKELRDQCHELTGDQETFFTLDEYTTVDFIRSADVRRSEFYDQESEKGEASDRHPPG